ncbi:MAG: zf-HC2 domain-containing protein [Oscillospiraceae bacterium]|nr:zf-HC2 domain-containing protein [Oscillospiraceae bacterium]
MNCDVIRDLLPLYAEDIASEASKKLIEEHLDCCTVCRGIARQMCAPIEAAPANTPDPILALKKQKKKNRRRVILACAFTALVIFLSWWIYMETHFRGSSLKTVTTDRETILSEMPELEISQDEFSLSEYVFEIPPVVECAESEFLVAISYEEIESYISDIIPQDADVFDICASNQSVTIGYKLNGRTHYIEYLDTDYTGNTDLIRKSIFVPKGSDNVHTAYETEYAGENHTTYEKQVTRHVWFGFLQIPK